MDELRITLLCKHGFRYVDTCFEKEEIFFKSGQAVKAIVRDDGIRIEYKEKYYSLPCSVRQISKYFKCE
jgi:hypothetical protein